MKRSIGLFVLGLGSCLPGIAHGAGIVWSNGHTYDAVFVAGNPTWFEARDAAAAMTLGGMPGHLATFTTRPEQEFVIAGLGGGSLLNAFWLGGYQDPGSPGYDEPYGGWNWITGEPWTGVALNDPVIPRADAGFNNTYFDGIRTEEHTITWWGTGGINDYNHSPDASPVPAQGFLVEFEVSSVPEPATFAVGAALALGCSLMRIRRARAG